MSNLYLYRDDDIPLQAIVQDLGYERYDPFGRILGKAYTEAVRLFMMPPQGGWTRITGECDESIPSALSQSALCIYVHDDQLTVYEGGQVVDTVEALTPHLATTQEAFQQALTQSHYEANDIPLPDDIQTMAQNLKSNQINKLFDKFMGKVGKFIQSDDDAARKLLNTNTISPRIHALMACLTIPSPYWHTPDFVTLRDAYQLHIRRQKNPNATLYPGDAEALEAVPDALQYTPVYGGKP